MLTIYMIGSVLSILILFLYYKKIFNGSYWVQIYIFLRNGIRLLDLENTNMDQTSWNALLITQTSCLILSLTILGSCYPFVGIHKCVIILLYPIGCCLIICGVEGFQEVRANPAIFFKSSSMLMLLGLCAFAIYMVIGLRVSS